VHIAEAKLKKYDSGWSTLRLDCFIRLGIRVIITRLYTYSTIMGKNKLDKRNKQKINQIRGDINATPIKMFWLWAGELNALD